MQSEDFRPDEIDQQIDHLLDTCESSAEADVPSRRMARQLRRFYQQQKQQEIVAQTWKEIVARYQARQSLVPGPGKVISMQHSARELQANKQQRTAKGVRTFARRLGILAAIVMIVLLVGSMAFILNAARRGKSVPPVIRRSSQIGSGGTPLPKPPHPITGGACTIDTTRPHPLQSTKSVPGLYIFAFNQQSDNLLYRYDPQTKHVVWKVKLCNAFESDGTIERNGILYLAGTDWTHESRSGSVSYLYALNETDGSAIWGIRFPTSVTPFACPTLTPGQASNCGSSPLDLGMIETPTIDNGILYVIQRTGIVYAFDATTGNQLWTFDTGSTAWGETQAGNGSIVDPSSIQVVDGVAYGSIVDRVFALDARSGKELWMHTFNKTLNINQSPAIANGAVYLTAFVPGYGTVTHPDTYVYAFDARSGKQKWVSAKMRGYLDGPIAFGGQVHVTSYDGVWYTLNPVSGALETQKMLPGGQGVGNPILIDGVLYDVTNTMLAVLNADGSPKWSVSITGEYPELQDAQNGIIYISARGSGIYAYRSTDGTSLWHYEGTLPQPEGQSMVTVVP